MKVLIVDDNVQSIMLLERGLKRYNYEVIGIQDATLIENVLNEHETFDVILLDQIMPNSTGLEIFEKLKNSLSELPPVIMVTAHGSLTLAVEFLKLGGADFVEKPINIEILDIKIKDVIRKRTVKNIVDQIHNEQNDHQNSSDYVHYLEEKVNLLKKAYRSLSEQYIAQNQLLSQYTAD